jgi:putative phosphoribosyl transferase
MLPLEGETVIVVDDGVATGGTARAALEVARAHGARRVVLAVPVGAPDTLAEMTRYADEVVAVATPTPFNAVGQWYRQFAQTPDGEVVALLATASSAPRVQATGDPPPTGSTARDDTVEIPIDGIRLTGQLTLPADPVGLVIFAHGSGSSRHSPRNQFVARQLNDAGLGTVLVDLLTPSEAFDRAMVFDVELLAARLRAVAHTVSRQPGCDGLPIGYFGASTGAAAALTAAAGDRSVGAVVSRGGRPDLAAPALPSVDAPTLLIVGSKDTGVLQLNRTAARHLGGEHRIEVVPGATHLFEEPGALEIVAQLAQGWFLEHLGTSATRPLDRRRRT